MKRKINEWFSVQLAKNPRRIVLFVILIFNIAFFFVSAVIINNLAVSGTEKMGFFEAALCTITMILDAGCIQFVIADIGKSGVAISIICIVIILVGMVTFTGAVIGYITNYISNFIENTNAGSRRLKISGHTVILNWNTRASEIINDLLYCKRRNKVVVLVSGRKKEIEKEIEERISDTVARENLAVQNECSGMPAFKRQIEKIRRRFKRNITVIVREGDVFSSKQLRDISLEKARTVIILGNDINNTVCKFEHKERFEEMNKGNSQIIKTLMQVADMTSADYSDDNQKIIVEVNDDWTMDVVEKIIKCKQVEGKCNIVPISVNQVLGQILAQFSLMPELNLVYQELFSNKGAAFFSEELTVESEETFISEYLDEHRNTIPLTFMDADRKSHFFYVAEDEKNAKKTARIESSGFTVELNHNFCFKQKNLIILGHNSKCEDIMRGLYAFSEEWKLGDSEKIILRVIVIDDEEHLKKMNHYQKYSFVIETVSANIYDKDLICSTINRFVSSNEEDTSVLILSDDFALNEDIDANALANLVYVQDIINEKKKDPSFDEKSIDLVVEIIDPKHHDIVSSYSVNNVVISNRYISKMVTQIGEKEALFDFYKDILTYDEDSSSGYNSKEIYIKKVSEFFETLPSACTAAELIRAVYNASVDKNVPEEKRYAAIVLGYIKHSEEMILFSGDQTEMKINIEPMDKLIVFSAH